MPSATFVYLNQIALVPACFATKIQRYSLSFAKRIQNVSKQEIDQVTYSASMSLWSGQHRGQNRGERGGQRAGQRGGQRG